MRGLLPIWGYNRRALVNESAYIVLHLEGCRTVGLLIGLSYIDIWGMSGWLNSMLNGTWCCSLIEQRRVKPNQLGTKTFDFGLTRVEEWVPNAGGRGSQYRSQDYRILEYFLIERHSLLNRHGLHVQETCIWPCWCFCVHKMCENLLLLQWCRTLFNPNLLAQILKHLTVLKSGKDAVPKAERPNGPKVGPFLWRGGIVHSSQASCKPKSTVLVCRDAEWIQCESNRMGW